MSSDPSAQPELLDPLDLPVDAVVYEVHPALECELPYLYGPPAESAASMDLGEQHAFVRAVDRVVGTVAAFFRRYSRPPDFAVPKRFGMSAILGITTALAILFGALKFGNAWPVFYLFFGMQAIAICLVQMFAGGAPRAASTFAGAIILPVFTLLVAMVSRHDEPLAGVLCVMLIFVPVGGLLGYITGTCAAGVFLVMDYLEPYLQGRPDAGSSSHPSRASAS